MNSLPVTIDAPTLRELVPYAPPFLLLDTIEAYVPGEQRLTAAKLLSQNDTFMQGHFPNYPIFPGVLIIEAAAQSCRVLMNLDHLTRQGIPPEALADALRQQQPPRGFLVESSFKHIEGTYPGDRLLLQAQLTTRREDLYTFKVAARVNQKEVGRGRLVLLRASSPQLSS